MYKEMLEAEDHFCGNKDIVLHVRRQFHQVNQMDRLQDKVDDNILLRWLAGAQHPEELMIFQMWLN